MKRTLAVSLVAAATTTLALAGCAVDESPEGGSSGGTEAKASGKLTVVCSAQEEVCQAWTKAFQEKTGITTNHVRLSSGETVARLDASKDSPEFDVWVGGPSDGYGAAVEDGLLAKTDPPTAKDIPAKYKDPNGMWYGIYTGALGFCSNKKMLNKLGVEPPTSWDDLLNPKLKQQVMMAHPSTSGTAYTTLWTQVTRLGGEKQALDYMKKLDANILQYSKSGSAPGQAAGRGEVAVAVIFSHDCTAYQEQGFGDILVTTFPKDGTGYEVGGVAMIKGAQNPAAAKKFVDFMLTPEAQEIGPTANSFQLHTNPNAKVDPRMVDLSKLTLVDYDAEAAAKARDELLKKFDAQVAQASEAKGD